MGLISDFSRMDWRLDSSDFNTTNGLRKSEVFWLSIGADLKSVDFKVDLDNDAENGYFLVLSLQMADVRYVPAYFCTWAIFK